MKGEKLYDTNPNNDPYFFRGKIPQKTGIKITKKLENTNLSPKKLEKQSPQK